MERLRDLYLLKKQNKQTKKFYHPPPSPAKGLLEGRGGIRNTSLFLGLYSRPPIRTKKRTRSTQKFGLGPLRNTSLILELYLRPPIRTKKQTWSTLRGAGTSGTHPRFRALLETTNPHKRTDSVQAKTLTRLTPEHIPVFRGLLKIEIKIEVDSGTHPRF